MAGARARLRGFSRCRLVARGGLVGVVMQVIIMMATVLLYFIVICRMCRFYLVVVGFLSNSSFIALLSYEVIVGC